MSDQQKTIVSLNLVSETCNATLAAISDPDESDQPLSDFTVLHKDFISLLSLLHASTTKVALSLKPSSPTYSASLAPLKDIAGHIANLSHNVRMVHKGHGETLLKEVHSTAKSIITSIQSFAQTLLTIQTSGSTSSGEAGDGYMVRTGAVHEVIDKARGLNGLSSNNFISVRKVWQQDHGPMADALQEVKEMSQPSSEDNCMEDGWDELGIELSNKLTPIELERVKTVATIIKIATLLHKNVIKRLLSSPSTSTESQANQVVDQLALSSPSLLAASDDLISTMYSPQYVEDISKQLETFGGVMSELQTRVYSLLPHSSLQDAMGGLSLSDNSILEGQAARKWFETCFMQLEKSKKQLSSTLASA